MILTLTRTGGFTGIPLKKTIDTTKLKKEEREKIEKLVMKAPKEIKTKNVSRPDQFTYTLSVEDGAISNNISLHEHSVTPEVKKLIDFILAT